MKKQQIKKKNSIIFNQAWINKAIEEGNIHFLPCRKDINLSIGEIIELKYENEIDKPDTKKIDKKNSILFESEWRKKYEDEKLLIPKKHSSKYYSLGEILELRYFEYELIRKVKKDSKKKCIKLGNKWW